jgi:hypothetical protein
MTFICANILHITKVQLFKTRPFRDWFYLQSHVDKWGGGGPLVVGPLEKASPFRWTTIKIWTLEYVMVLS